MTHTVSVASIVFFIIFCSVLDSLCSFPLKFICPHNLTVCGDRALKMSTAGYLSGKGPLIGEGGVVLYLDPSRYPAESSGQGALLSRSSYCLFTLLFLQQASIEHLLRSGTVDTAVIKRQGVCPGEVYSSVKGLVIHVSYGPFGTKERS